MRTRVRALTLAALLLTTACGGGSDAASDLLDPALQQQLADFEACLGDGLDDFVGTLGGLESLFAVAGNPAAAEALGITWNEAPGVANAYDFSLPVDLDGDSAPDLTLAGRASFTSDPAQGFSLGDAVDVTWTVEDSALLSGSADLRFQLAATGILLSGTIELTDAAGCKLTLTADEAEPVNIVLDGVWPPALAQQGSTIVRIDGGFLLRLEYDGDVLEATALFDAANGKVSIDRVFINGSSITTAQFEYDVGPLSPPIGTTTAQTWAGTWVIDYACQSSAANQPTPSQTPVRYSISIDGNPDPQTGEVPLVVAASDTQSSLSLTCPATWTPLEPNLLEFTLDYNKRGIEFEEVVILQLFDDNGSLGVEMDLAYASTNPNSPFPPGVCFGTGSKQ